MTQQVVISLPPELDANQEMKIDIKNKRAFIGNTEHIIEFGESTSILVGDKEGNIIGNTTHVVKVLPVSKKTNK